MHTDILNSLIAIYISLWVKTDGWLGSIPDLYKIKK